MNFVVNLLGDRLVRRRVKSARPPTRSTPSPPDSRWWPPSSITHNQAQPGTTRHNQAQPGLTPLTSAFKRPSETIGIANRNEGNGGAKNEIHPQKRMAWRLPLPTVGIEKGKSD